ncbi:MAG: hypothetical protein M1837_006854 [Sclerophora amabilis]|nr:MAG: hypothetical protein M1837_006854 [Sclerophora amabilis]
MVSAKSLARATFKWNEFSKEHPELYGPHEPHEPFTMPAVRSNKRVTKPRPLTKKALADLERKRNIAIKRLEANGIDPRLFMDEELDQFMTFNAATQRRIMASYHWSIDDQRKTKDAIHRLLVGGLDPDGMDAESFDWFKRAPSAVQQRSIEEFQQVMAHMQREATINALRVVGFAVDAIPTPLLDAICEMPLDTKQVDILSGMYDLVHIEQKQTMVRELVAHILGRDHSPPWNFPNFSAAERTQIKNYIDNFQAILAATEEPPQQRDINSAFELAYPELARFKTSQNVDFNLFGKDSSFENADPQMFRPQMNEPAGFSASNMGSSLAHGYLQSSQMGQNQNVGVSPFNVGGSHAENAYHQQFGTDPNQNAQTSSYTVGGSIGNAYQQRFGVDPNQNAHISSHSAGRPVPNAYQQRFGVDPNQNAHISSHKVGNSVRSSYPEPYKANTNQKAPANPFDFSIFSSSSSSDDSSSSSSSAVGYTYSRPFKLEKNPNQSPFMHTFDSKPNQNPNQNQNAHARTNPYTLTNSSPINHLASAYPRGPNPNPSVRVSPYTMDPYPKIPSSESIGKEVRAQIEQKRAGRVNRGSTRQR